MHRDLLLLHSALGGADMVTLEDFKRYLEFSFGLRVNSGGAASAPIPARKDKYVLFFSVSMTLFTSVYVYDC